MSEARGVSSTQVLVSSHVARSGRVSPATIEICTATGKITAITDSVLPRSAFPEDVNYRDLTPYVIIPGLVDTHVHLNEPGRSEWEGFYTGTLAAASGGVTTVVDMPLNSNPPTTTVENLNQKLVAARNKCFVDVAFYGGIVPDNIDELKALVHQGVCGFKCFLIDSGVEEFPPLSPSDVERAFRELADESTVILFHAEMVPPDADPSSIESAQIASSPPGSDGDSCEYSTFLRSRPPSLETHAIEQIISLAHLAPRLPLHIVHLSTTEAIPLLRKAQSRGIAITAETCPHYLSIAAEQISDGHTHYKCCPPIRAQSNQNILWEELLQHSSQGVIKTIVSDHSPCTIELKRMHFDPAVSALGRCNEDVDIVYGNFFEAWGGISSIGLGLPIVWTEMSRRGMTSATLLEKAISDIIDWCCWNTAVQVGLEKCKGRIAVGHDADLCVFDPHRKWVVEPCHMLFKNKVSPYQGRIMQGMVRETWLRGNQVFSYDDPDLGRVTRGCIGKLLLQPRIGRTESM